MKKILRYAFLVAAAMLSTAAMADTTVVGPEDNTNKGYYAGDYKARYSVENNKKICIQFTVSTATDDQLEGDVWNPWYAWAVNFWDGTLNAVTIEPRDYGWEDKTANNRWTENWAKYWRQNYPVDWESGYNFRDNILQGATVVVTVERIGVYVIVSYDITTTGGKKYRQFVVKEYGDGTTIWFDLVVDHAHITIDNDKTVTTDVPVAGRLVGNYNRCSGFTTTDAVRKNFTIPANGTLNFKFKNYSAAVETWQSWMFEMLYNGKYCNMVAGNNNQWGELQSSPGTFENTNWPTADDILTKMEGATVDLTIARNDANVTVTAVHTPVSGEDFTLKYTFSSTEADFATSAAEFHFMSDYGYIDLLPYELNVSSNNDSFGTVSAGTAYVGEDVTVSATPASTDYTFVNWTENNEIVSTDAEYTFTAWGNRTLVANFTNSTGINTVKETAPAAKAVRYNVAGQQVSNAFKGMVIENGKKFLVK